MAILTFDPHDAPPDEEHLALLVEAFEQATLPRERWTHAAHLCVGSYYIATLGFKAALPSMRSRVRAYNEASGTPNTETRGYHETLTRLWLLVLDRLRQHHPLMLSAALAQLAVRRYGHRGDLHTSLYTFHVVKDPIARREWVEPDRQMPLGIIE